MLPNDVRDNDDTSESKSGFADFIAGEPTIDRPASARDLANSEPVADAPKKGVKDKDKDAVDKASENQDQSDVAGQSTNEGVAQDTNQKQGFGGKLKKFSLSHKKGLLAGGGIGASIIALIIASFSLILPLKLVHIGENLGDFFDGFGDKSSFVFPILKAFFVKFDKGWSLDGV